MKEIRSINKENCNWKRILDRWFIRNRNKRSFFSNQFSLLERIRFPVEHKPEKEPRLRPLIGSPAYALESVPREIKFLSTNLKFFMSSSIINFQKRKKKLMMSSYKKLQLCERNLWDWLWTCDYLTVNNCPTSIEREPSDINRQTHVHQESIPWPA